MTVIACRCKHNSLRDHHKRFTSNTKYHATANSKKINTHYHTAFDTKFAFYDVNGNLDTTATMFVDGIGIEDNLSYASGNVPSTLTTNPFISGDANSAPLFGSHLQHSYLQISGPNSFFVNGKGDTMVIAQ